MIDRGSIHTRVRRNDRHIAWGLGRAICTKQATAHLYSRHHGPGKFQRPLGSSNGYLSEWPAPVAGEISYLLIASIPCSASRESCWRQQRKGYSMI